MGKLKRIVAKLLIASQIYGNVFQGMAHAADLADSYEIRNEIHLHSSMDKHGSLRLALGTDGDGSNDLKWIDIPSYQTAKKLAPQIDLGKILEVEEDNLSDGSCGEDNISTDDENSFECDGVTRNSQAAYFTLQGLNFSISNDGVMVISGSQKDRSKPIFLSGESPIILNSLEANALEVMAPRIISRGQSNIERLMLTGIEGSQKTVFINDGDLTAKQLFLNNITGDNQGSILAASLGVIGELESSGVIAVDELALGENAVAKLDEDSCADIKTLFLSKASHLQNQQVAENVLNIGVLNSIGGLGGSITNHGTMAIVEVAEDSAFQEIVNRHFMGIAQGDLKVETFTNSDAFGLEQGSLQVGNGTNSGVLKANDLEVGVDFTNDKTGIVTVPLVSGAGELLNLGKIETAENLALDGQKFTNSAGGSVTAKSVTGLTHLAKFTNAEDASIDAGQALVFADNTKVINQGLIKAHDLTLVGKQTTQDGDIRVSNLEITGGGEFVNCGDIEVEQGLNLELNSFINKGNLSTKVLNGHQKLRILSNYSGSLFKVRDGPLGLAETTLLGNLGTIEAQSLSLYTDKTSLYQSGTLKAANISLTGVNPFTNSGQILASEKLSLNLAKFVNENKIVSPLIDISKVTELTNAGSRAVIDTQGSDLTFDKVNVVNNGTFKAGNYLFRNGSLVQSGKIEGKFLRFEGSTAITTTDGQTINLTDKLEAAVFGRPWDIRGKINARSFTSYSPIDLYGNLTVAEQFFGDKTVVHSGAKLISKNLHFSTNNKIGAVIHAGGELQADTLSGLGGSSSFTVNGQAFIKKSAEIGTLKVGEHGKLQGHKGSSLSLSLAEEAEISGLVDVDVLAAAKKITLTQKGILVSRKTTELQSSLDIAKEAGAELHDLKINSYASITNNGKLKLIGQEKTSFMLINRGQAYIEAKEKIWGSADAPSPEAIKLFLINCKKGHLTLKKGEFDLSSKGSETDSENAGTLVNESSSLWFGGFKNTGVWTSPGGSVIRNYSGQDMGDFRVDGELSVKSLDDGAYVLDPNHVETGEHIIVYPRKRNGAAISVGRDLRIRVRGQNALLNNHYGLMQADGYLNLFSQKQITNMAGIISSKGGGLLSAREIKVKRDEISRKPHPTYGKWCDGHYYDKKGCQVRDSCSGGNQCTEIFYYREQSDEGWINIGGGDLEIDTDSLEVLASHIVSKGRLFLKRQRIDLSKHEGGELQGIKGVLVQSRQDRMAYEGMCGRGRGDDLAINKAGIFSYSQMKLESHGLKIEGISKTQTMDMVQALTQTVKNIGFEVNMDQARDVLIDLVSGAKSESRQPHSLIGNKNGQFLFNLPHEKNESPTYGKGPVPVLTDNYITFDRNLPQHTNPQHVVSKRVLESLLDTLVQKALCNPQRSDFSRKIYENSQVFAINNMKQRLLQNFEAKTEEEATKIVEVRYKQLIPITYEDMSVYAKDVKTCAKQMLLFELGSNYRATLKLKSMEADLDQEICDLRPQVFVPKESVQETEKTSANLHSDSQIINDVHGDMTLKGSAGLSCHGGTTKVSGGTLSLEALAMRQGDTENFYEQSSRPLIRNLGNNNELNFIVDHDIMLTGALIDTGGKYNKINMFTPGNVIDKALGLSSRNTTHTHSKRSHTKTVTDEVHMIPTEYSGLGEIKVNLGGGMYTQAPIITTSMDIKAQYLNIAEVHNQRLVQSTTETYGRTLFGGSTKKTVEHVSQAFFSQGAKLKGPEFTAHVRHLIATNTLFATNADFTATEKAEINTGTDQSQSQTVSISKGIVWNKSSVKTTKDVTRINPIFEHNVYIHSPEVIVERVRGSKGTFDKIISDSEIIFKDVIDIHESTSESQKQLTAGASIFVSVLVSLATMNPASGATIAGAMASAAYATLYSQAAICMIEKDGNFNKAMKDLGKRNIGKAMVISALTAGLTKGIGDKIGITNSIAFDNLAKKHLLQSAINTSIAIADGQKPEDAIRQGLTSAATNMMAAYIAGKIGDARSEDKGVDRISSATHKGLHAALGALGGGLHSVLAGGKFENGLLPGAIGAVTGEIFAELTGNKQLGDLLATGIVTGVGLDGAIGHQTSSNATEYNFQAHQGDRLYLEDLEIVEKDKLAYEEGDKELSKDQQDFERGRVEYVEKSLKTASHARGGRPLRKRSRDFIVDNANETYIEHYGRKGAINLLKDPRNYVPLVDGAYTVLKAGFDHTFGDLSDSALNAELSRGGKSIGIDLALAGAAKGVFKVVDLVANKTGKLVSNVGSHIKFKNPGQPANSNFMYGVNRNVMPVKATGTYGNGYGLGSQGLGQSKQPTVQSLANDYGSAIKPKVNNELTYRIDGSKIPDTQIGGGRLPTSEQHIGSKQVSQSFNKNKVVQKSEVERVNLDPKNRSAHELYKQDLKAESAQALRDRIYKAEKRELPEIKDLQDIGFKGQNPEGLKRNNVTGRIQANTDSQNTASYLYRKQVREFQNEVDVRGPSTTQRIKAPGPTLETVFEDGSRILLRAESKTGVAKVEITDTYRNIREKITPLFNNGDLK